MKKRVLFVIDSLTIGGAEKSLLSLLQMAEGSKLEIDLLLFKKGGDLERYIPDYVNVLSVPEFFEFLSGKGLLKTKSISFFYLRVKTSILLRLNNRKNKALHSEQVVYKSIKKALYPVQKKYDVAVAYSQGMPTYFVADKVLASKKLAWINTDYVHTLYDKEIDYESYKKMTKIVAVSKHIHDSVSEMKKEYQHKVEVIMDTINPRLIGKMALEYDHIEEYDHSAINILTVGRLVAAKGYDQAIETAVLLKKSGCSFKWFVIGEGPERNRLLQFIAEYELDGFFILLGKKINPYPYMKNCDIYVQPSVKEGFGLTVSEAKILKRPIVCTGFPTAHEIIHHNVDGQIVGHDASSIYMGVKKYMDDIPFRNKIVNRLYSQEEYSPMDQLKHFYVLVNDGKVEK